MMEDWENKKLGDVIQPDIDSLIPVEAEKKYPMVGVYSFGNGLFDREEVSGINTSYKHFYKLKSDHIVLSQLFGWEGAIALSSKEFEGKFVSSQFPTFLVDEDIADKKFIIYFLNQKSIWKKLLDVGKGMGSRRRTLTPSNLLDLSITLPAIQMQRNIVSVIDAVKSRIELIKQIKLEQEKDLRNLKYSLYCDAEKKYNMVTLKTILDPSDNYHEPVGGTVYRQMGVRVWGEGAYERESIDGSQTQYSYFMKVETDDLVINKIWVRNGALAVVPEELNGCFVSTEFPTFKFDHKVLNPKWIEFLIKQKKFWDLCAEKSFGTSGKNRIKPEEFLRVEIPLPSIEEQNLLVEMLDKLTEVKSVHKQSDKELKQLVPSLLDKAFKGELVK